MAVSEQVDVFRQFQRGSEAVFRIVIAEDQHDADARLAQPGHALGKEKAGAVVPPHTVEDVAGDEHQPAFPIDRERDQVIECLARRVLQPRRLLGRALAQPGQRAVEMQVGRMQEAKSGHERDGRTGCRA